MFTQSYESTIDYIAEYAPSLSGATEYFKWVEDIATLISHVYSKHYDDVIERLTNTVKRTTIPFLRIISIYKKYVQY